MLVCIIIIVNLYDAVEELIKSIRKNRNNTIYFW